MTNIDHLTKKTKDLNKIEKTNILLVNRKKSRKLLFQELYSLGMNKLNITLFREAFFNNVHTFTIDEKYLSEMHKIIPFHESFFIYIFNTYAPKFNITKMSLSNILPVYIGLAEMFFVTEEIPAKVSINEAVEIAKVYGDDSAKKVVNGILNKVYKDFDNLYEIRNNDYTHIKESCFKNKVSK